MSYLVLFRGKMWEGSRYRVKSYEVERPTLSEAMDVLIHALQVSIAVTLELPDSSHSHLLEGSLEVHHVIH